MNYGQVIAIDGSIGAGKSTLMKALAEILKFRPYREPVEENPFLADFYREPHRWSFAMQMYMLRYRYGVHKSAAYEATGIGGHKGVLIDRPLMPGDWVFAYTQFLCGYMSQREWKVYSDWFDILMCSFSAPSLLLYLDVEPEVSFERIKNRHRDAEINIDLEYLVKLRRAYMDALVMLESGKSRWGRGVVVERVPWNVDSQGIGLIVDLINRLSIQTHPI